jgi:hypothetical protein
MDEPLVRCQVAITHVSQYGAPYVKCVNVEWPTAHVFDDPEQVFLRIRSILLDEHRVDISMPYSNIFLSTTRKPHLNKWHPITRHNEISLLKSIPGLPHAWIVIREREQGSVVPLVTNDPSTVLVRGVWDIPILFQLEYLRGTCVSNVVRERLRSFGLVDYERRWGSLDARGHWIYYGGVATPVCVPEKFVEAIRTFQTLVRYRRHIRRDWAARMITRAIRDGCWVTI